MQLDDKLRVKKRFVWVFQLTLLYILNKTSGVTDI